MDVATPGPPASSPTAALKMGPVLVSLRPHQWTKNLVLFAALAFSKHLFETGPLLRASLAFALFCLVLLATIVMPAVRAQREGPVERQARDK